MMRLCLAVLASITLCSCEVLNVLFVSIFPPTLTTVTAQKNLWAEILETEGSLYNLGVEQAGDPSTEYVFLFGPSLFILDSELNISQPPDAFPRNIPGSRTMVDAQGRILVGNLLFEPDSTGGLSIVPSPFIPSLDNPGFAVAETANVVNLWTNDSGQLNADVYSADWATFMFNIAVPLSAAGEAYNMRAAYAEAASGSVFLILDNKSDQRTSCLTIPATDFLGGFADLSPAGLFGAYPTLFTTTNKLDTRTYGFAGGLAIIFDESTNDFIACSLSTGEVQATLHSVARRDFLQIAYSPSGDHYFIYDGRSRTVTRLTAWWNR